MQTQRPTGHVEGVSDVPDGLPPGWQSLSEQVDAVQIATGSSVMAPEGGGNQQVSFQRPRRSDTAPKTEEVEGDIYAIPSVEDVSHDGNTETEAGEVKDEPLAEDYDLQPPDNYYNNFQRLFAGYSRNRHTASRSSRQEVFDGPQRSRHSPRTSGSERSNRERSLTSAMFFPDSHDARDSTPTSGSSRSSTRNESTSQPSSPHPSHHENDGGVYNLCQCPISYDCQHRAVNELDCRPLVREWKRWDERVDQEAFDLQRIAEPHGNTQTTPQGLRRLIGILNDFDQAATYTQRQTAVHNMRDWILDMQDVTVESGDQQAAVTQDVLPRLRQFLHPRRTQIRRSGGLPDYIEESLKLFLIKWGRGDFDGSIHRGLILIETLDVNEFGLRRRYRVDERWQHYVSAQYFGEGNLVNGQIWMSRAELRRDGVHAPLVAGISGSSRKGAYSIVLGEFNEKKNEGYADIDMGNVIDYVGTALPDSPGLGPTNIEDPEMNNPNSWNEAAAPKPTVATRAMMKSLETGKPVRVIRSWKMCKVVKNKPGKGYRYDGLYRVVGKTALKQARQIWSFRLERVTGQGRLRGFRENEPHPDSTGHRKGYFYRERQRNGGRRR